MHLEIGALWDFYYHCHLGAVAQRSLQRGLRELWPDVRGCNLVGYGFAAPLLRPFMQEAQRTLAFMPEEQGCHPWPRDGKVRTALVPSGAWPLPNGFVDRLIVAHGLEGERHVDDLMNEAWRVLAPEGRIIVVAANRQGVWARSDATPFGVGRPYSLGQLERLLKGHELTPEHRAGALYFPPSQRRFWLRSAGAAERLGRRLDMRRLAGAVIVEATKQVFAAPPPSGSRVSARAEPARGLRPAGVAGMDDPARRR